MASRREQEDPGGGKILLEPRDQDIEVGVQYFLDLYRSLEGKTSKASSPLATPTPASPSNTPGPTRLSKMACPNETDKCL